MAKTVKTHLEMSSLSALLQWKRCFMHTALHLFALWNNHTVWY